MKTPSRLIANVKTLHFKQGSIIAIKKNVLKSTVCTILI